MFFGRTDAESEAPILWPPDALEQILILGKIAGRRKWQPTPVFLPEKSHGQRSLVGYSSWGHKEPDMT